MQELARLVTTWSFYTQAELPQNLLISACPASFADAKPAHRREETIFFVECVDNVTKSVI